MTGRVIRFMMGMLSFTLGSSIILWVLYNLCIERQEEFTGNSYVPNFGIAGAFVAVGVYWMRVAITGTKKRKTNAQIARDSSWLP